MDKEIKTVEEFVEWLSSMECIGYCENQYAGENAERTRNNLTLYLKAIQERNPKVLFLGKAPSWKGCTITGIPFTDENRLQESYFLKEIKGLQISGAKTPPNEGSGHALWDVLNSNQHILPLLWNIFPFHPYKGNDKKNNHTNRKPYTSEISKGKEITAKLISLFPSIEKIYGIGRVASKYSRDVVYIRHPSYGGSLEFRDSADAILKSFI